MLHAIVPSPARRLARTQPMLIAQFAQVTRELESRLAQALDLARGLRAPETFLAAAVSFQDLDMNGCLQRSFARYQAALAGVDRSVRSWREHLRALDPDSLLELQKHGAPLAELTTILTGDWHSQQPRAPRPHGCKGFFDELASLLEQLDAAFRRSGMGCYR